MIKIERNFKKILKYRIFFVNLQNYSDKRISIQLIFFELHVKFKQVKID